MRPYPFFLAPSSFSTTQDRLIFRYSERKTQQHNSFLPLKFLSPQIFTVVDIVLPPILLVYWSIIVTINHPVHTQHRDMVLRRTAFRPHHQGVPSYITFQSIIYLQNIAKHALTKCSINFQYECPEICFTKTHAIS